MPQRSEDRRRSTHANRDVRYAELLELQRSIYETALPADEAWPRLGKVIKWDTKAAKIMNEPTAAGSLLANVAEASKF